jgi:hypothetical protein
MVRCRTCGEVRGLSEEPWHCASKMHTVHRVGLVMVADAEFEVVRVRKK